MYLGGWLTLKKDISRNPVFNKAGRQAIQSLSWESPSHFPLECCKFLLPNSPRLEIVIDCVRCQ